MAYFGENWDDSEFPLAYLITIRTYGTWLHGDHRTSVDTHSRYSVRGPVRRPANENLEHRMKENQTQPALVLDEVQREAVAEAIREVCYFRRYDLHAVNPRSNHAHAVVSARIRPDLIANASKSYATRKLRERRLVDIERNVWARGRNRRYLWKNDHVSAAIDYVLYCQGNEQFEDWYGSRFDD